jgi:folate-binding protein YgfZ
MNDVPRQAAVNLDDRAAAAAAIDAADGGPAVVAPMSGSAVFIVRGSDARSFLHGQLANDITRLEVGQATRSLLLNHRGHALAEAMVLRSADHLLLVVEDGTADWVAKTLAEHIIFDDVALVRVADVATVTLQGARAAEVLARVLPHVTVPAPAGATDAPGFVHLTTWPGTQAGVEVVAYPRRRSVAGGFDVVAYSSVGESATERAAVVVAADLAAAGALTVGRAAIDAARVAAGATTAGADAGEGVLPQEAGLTAALSYRKGCYLGQEVMARIEARGNLKRGLATVELTGEGADRWRAGSASERAIVLDGRTVGVLGTTALMPDGTIRALAVLRRDLAQDVTLAVGGLAVRVADRFDAPPTPGTR